MKKIFKRLFALVLASILFAAPVTTLAAVNPDWVYVDPDGYKSFGFDTSPYYIQRGGSGALENNENGTYWRVEQGGSLNFHVNFVNPVFCRFTLVKIGNPNQLILLDEDYTEVSYGRGADNLSAGNYAIYVVPMYTDALINFYSVDTR